ISRRLDAPPTKFHKLIEIVQHLPMNHGLAGSRWLKLGNPLPEMQDDLDACLRYLTSLLRGPCLLDDGLCVANNRTLEIVLQRLGIAAYSPIDRGDVRSFLRCRGRRGRGISPTRDGDEPERYCIHHENRGKDRADRVIVDDRV